MSVLLPLTLAARGIVALWFTLIGSGGATLFPDLVLANGIFADSFIDRSTVRLIAVPLFIACAVLLTDHYYGWSRGMLL
jgi:hypothetical protein